MTKLDASLLVETKLTRGDLDDAFSELAHDPEFVANGLALAIAEDVVQSMEDLGVSNAELARRMGVSRSYVTRVLDAPPNLTLLSISKVALALGLTPEVRLRRPRHASELETSFTDSAAPTKPERGLPNALPISSMRDVK